MLRSIYRILKKFARLFGYDLMVSKVSKESPKCARVSPHADDEPWQVENDLMVSKVSEEDSEYARVIPYAGYAPWQVDSAFLTIYGLIKNNTLVDIYRCYELCQLIKETSNLEGSIIEVGVWRGGTGVLIAKQAELSGISSDVYLCDTFAGVVKAGINDTSYKNGEHGDTSIELVNDLISRVGVKNTKILVGIFPEDTSDMITDDKFRFCHVDVDVYQSAKDIVEWIWDKLVVGGIIVFDDYGFESCDGVTKFVDEERNKSGRVVLHNLNGHGIIIKTEM